MLLIYNEEIPKGYIQKLRATCISYGYEDKKVKNPLATLANIPEGEDQYPSSYFITFGFSYTDPVRVISKEEILLEMFYETPTKIVVYMWFTFTIEKARELWGTLVHEGYECLVS